jgi:hypothetical protein
VWLALEDRSSYETRSNRGRVKPLQAISLESRRRFAVTAGPMLFLWKTGFAIDAIAARLPCKARLRRLVDLDVEIDRLLGCGPIDVWFMSSFLGSVEHAQNLP